MKILFAASSGAAHDTLFANILWAVALTIFGLCLLVWNWRTANAEARKAATSHHMHRCHWAHCTPAQIEPNCIMHNRPIPTERPNLRIVR